MRARNTIEYLGVWEQLHNPNFNSIEFDAFRNQEIDKWNRNDGVTNIMTQLYMNGKKEVDSLDVIKYWDYTKVLEVLKD